MIGWFSGRKRQAEANAKVDSHAAIDAVSKLGALMEEFPSSVLDSSMLPLPKPQMKAAIRTLWSAWPAQRNVLEIGYLHLADFQDGVGQKPINLALPDESDPKQIAAALEKTLFWKNRTNAEMEELMREIKELRANATD